MRVAAGTSSTIRPSVITSTRLAISRAAARSWVTKSTAIPSECRSRLIRLSTEQATWTSRALVGSSHNRPRQPRAGGRVRDALDQQLLDRPPRREGGAGVLEDHLDALAADAVAVHPAGVALLDARRDPQRCRLAGSGLAHQGNGLAVADGESGNPTGRSRSVCKVSREAISRLV